MYRWMSLLTFGLVCLFACYHCGQCQAQPGQTQQDNQIQPGKPKTGKSDLLDGVLDLVKEPDPSKSGKPELTPGEVGLAGENLGEQSSNPLQAVRQSMLIAAGFMQKGASGESTQRLQSDIVTRLDELIEQLEGSQEDQQQSQSEQNSSEESQTAQQSRNEGEPTGEESEQQQAGEEQTENAQPSEMQRSDSGNTGETADTKVRLSNPRDLQMDVWGMLPDNVRAQMQSQMVEQFLPSYRAKIEAYFRALLRQTR